MLYSAWYDKSSLAIEIALRKTSRYGSKFSSKSFVIPQGAKLKYVTHDHKC